MRKSGGMTQSLHLNVAFCHWGGGIREERYWGDSKARGKVHGEGASSKGSSSLPPAPTTLFHFPYVLSTESTQLVPPILEKLLCHHNLTCVVLFSGSTNPEKSVQLQCSLPLGFSRGIFSDCATPETPTPLASPGSIQGDPCKWDSPLRNLGVEGLGNNRRKRCWSVERAPQKTADRAHI